MNELLIKRFWKKVSKMDGCWLWTGSRANGYGAFRGGTVNRAHRFSWLIHHGEIPSGLCVLHKCDVPLCVNPDHLFLGTKAENNADRAAKGRTKHPVVSRDYPEKVRRGEQINTAKLTCEKVKQIRSLFGSFKLKELAANFGVSHSMIWLIVNGKSWKHVV